MQQAEGRRVLPMRCQGGWCLQHHGDGLLPAHAYEEEGEIFHQDLLGCLNLSPATVQGAMGQEVWGWSRLFQCSHGLQIRCRGTR